MRAACLAVTDRLHTAESFLQGYKFYLLSRNPACHCMEVRSSLPFLKITNCLFLNHTPLYLFKIHFNIILSPKRLTSKFFSFSFPHQNSTYISLSPYVTRQMSQLLFNLITYIAFRKDFKRWVHHSAILFICTSTSGLISTWHTLICILTSFSHVCMRLNRQSVRRWFLIWSHISQQMAEQSRLVRCTL